MAKAFTVVASALCLLSFIGCSAYAKADSNEFPKHFRITGFVYCDTCQVKFQTRISNAVEGAELRLSCKNKDTGAETFAMNKVFTDGNGQYQFFVGLDHLSDNCYVSLVNNPDSKCNKVVPEIGTGQATASLDGGVGFNSHSVSNLGFQAHKTHPDCKAVLKEMGFHRPEDILPK